MLIRSVLFHPNHPPPLTKGRRSVAQEGREGKEGYAGKEGRICRDGRKEGYIGNEWNIYTKEGTKDKQRRKEDVQRRKEDGRNDAYEREERYIGKDGRIRKEERIQRKKVRCIGKEGRIYEEGSGRNRI